MRPWTNAYLLAALFLAGCADPVEPTVKRVTLEVRLEGGGAGSVFADPSGVDCGPVCRAAYPPGTTVLLSAKPDFGMEFAGWGGACDTPDRFCELVLDESAVVTAAFEELDPPPPPGSHVLTVERLGAANGTLISEPAGIDCPGTCSLEVAAGESVTLWAMPGLHSQLTAWGGDCAGSVGASCQIVFDADHGVTASFGWMPCAADADNDPSNGCYALPVTSGYAVSVTVGGDASGAVVTDVGSNYCDTACVFEMPAGDVIFTATPATTAVFASWGGACAGVVNDKCPLTIAGPVTVSATFTAAP